MRGGPETRALEALLRRRGTRTAGDPAIEREIRERYTDECAVLLLDASVWRGPVARAVAATATGDPAAGTP